MTERKSILFLMNHEFGQSSVVLAVAYELLIQNELDVHIASWSPLESRALALSERVQAEKAGISIRPITFHSFPLQSILDSWLKNTTKSAKADLPHPPGLNGAARLRRLTPQVLAAWDPEEHIKLYEWCGKLVEKVKPSLVVLDPFLPPAHDTCRKLKLNHAVLSPCTLASGLILQQPWLAAFWKYPGPATGFSYPLPWSKIPANIYCIFTMIACLWDPRIKTLNAARSSYGINDRLASFTPWVKDTPHICPSLPEIDLPMTIASNVHLCGPILLATTPVAHSDPALLEWLQKAPTVLVALGTNHEARADIVRELALGIRVLLDSRPDIQVLWNLKTDESSEDEDDHMVLDCLGEKIQKGRVRIECWLKADPVALLETGNIVCFVHHGGANSYFEATWYIIPARSARGKTVTTDLHIRAGIPQIVVPQWYDTYDYATRVEYLGIGLYGNKVASHKCKVDMENYKVPRMIDAKEFEGALLKVAGANKGDAAASVMKERARAVGELCKESGGRVQAAQILRDLVIA